MTQYNGVEMSVLVEALGVFTSKCKPVSNVECFEGNDGLRIIKHTDFGNAIRVFGQEMQLIENAPSAKELAKSSAKRFYGSIYSLVAPEDPVCPGCNFFVICFEDDLRIFFKKEGDQFALTSLRQIIDECPEFMTQLLEV